MTYKVIDDITAVIEEEKSWEKLPKEEKKDEPGELVQGELAEDGEDGGEEQVEGSEGGDRPGREGKSGIQIWMWIPHVGHSQGQYPPRICTNIRKALKK